MLIFPAPFDTFVLSRWLRERVACGVRLICLQLSSVAYEIYNTSYNTISKSCYVSVMEHLSACGNVCLNLETQISKENITRCDFSSHLLP